jgi:hypothetical protein
MEKNTPNGPTRQDGHLLRSTLLKLTAAQKIICTVVIAVVVLIWYDLLNELVAFGHTVDYSPLHSVLGARIVAMLTQYNPYFWWAVVALGTLIIAYFLTLFVHSTQRHVRTKLVDAPIVNTLARQLSTPAKEVLLWAWQDRRDPITVGDLQRASNELRSGRFDKISLARDHAGALLDRNEESPEAREQEPFLG